jgi:endoglucanase
MPRTSRAGCALLAGSARRITPALLLLSLALAPTANADTSTTQGEAMTLPSSGRIVTDSAAQGQRAVVLSSNGALTTSVASPVDRLSIIARGDQCSGAPQMRISLGGTVLTTVAVGSTTWRTYDIPLATRLEARSAKRTTKPKPRHKGSRARRAAAGSTLSIAFTNDLRRGGCDRNLRVDAFTSTSTTTAPSPTPTPAPTPAPTPTATPTATATPTPTPAPTPTATPTPTVTPTPTPPTTPTPTTLPAPTGALWNNPWPDSPWRKQAAAWRSTRPADAARMDAMGAQPMAEWLGEWNTNVGAEVDRILTLAAGANARPVLALYAIPMRDCGSYSAGGLSAAAYRAWIDQAAGAIRGRGPIVVLEPDALAQTTCLTADRRTEREALLREAVGKLADAGAYVYIDAGHATWLTAADAADRLLRVGIDRARGFAVNTSNFGSTTSQVTYGRTVSSLVGGKPFVLDTSRNGNGYSPDGQWCNPPGRALGAKPTLSTGLAGVDGFLWVKRPGESDGTCNGGPAAGGWWADYALDLAKSAGW